VWRITDCARIANSPQTGGRPLKHTRYYWLLLAEGHLTRRLFGGSPEERGAAAARPDKASAQSGADFDDDAGAQGKVSTEPLEKRAHCWALHAHQIRHLPLPVPLETPWTKTG
jgi:hypothetical protein